MAGANCDVSARTVYLNRFQLQWAYPLKRSFQHGAPAAAKVRTTSYTPGSNVAMVSAS
jgi:hypothetical protein